MSTAFDKWNHALRNIEQSEYGFPPAIFPPGYWRGKLIEMMGRAQVFVFENTADLPPMTDFEAGLFLDGYLPFPFDICWFEWAIEDQECGLLIMKLEDGRHLIQVLLNNGEQLRYGGWIHFLTRGKATSLTMKKPYSGLDFFDPPKMAADKGWCEEFSEIADWTSADEVSYAFCAVRLNLMVNSSTTTITKIDASDKLNARRKKRGKLPLVSHTVVDLVPKEMVVCQKGGTHASPRLHWRRSHLRTYANGKKVVIPMCLVGRADIGVVAHDYRVSARPGATKLGNVPVSLIK